MGVELRRILWGLRAHDAGGFLRRVRRGVGGGRGGVGSVGCIERLTEDMIERKGASSYIEIVNAR